MNCLFFNRRYGCCNLWAPAMQAKNFGSVFQRKIAFATKCLWLQESLWWCWGYWDQLWFLGNPFHSPALRSSEPRSRLTRVTGAVKAPVWILATSEWQANDAGFHPSWLHAEGNPNTFFLNLNINGEVLLRQVTIISLCQMYFEDSPSLERYFGKLISIPSPDWFYLGCTSNYYREGRGGECK